MGKSLVIVESDAKAKTINRFLGKNYVVKASVGHIKNLPKNRIGVDIEKGFEPELITIRGRGKVLKELKRLASVSDQVYLATDPDREGEAIAAHLALEIENNNPNIHRIFFHEITKDAIQQAVKKPQEIDTDLVESQKARRVLDRLVGYQVSPFLWKTIYRGLSAGRVQTVALGLIARREEEIAAFTPEEYWSVEADFSCENKGGFHSKLHKIGGEDVHIPDEAAVQKHVAAIQKETFQIDDLSSKKVTRKPSPPYTTSTFQQDAARKFGMSTSRIMAVAQQLYEGIDLPDGRVGLITYMRTDSTRLAESALEEARVYVAESYGIDYVPEKPAVYKTKKSAQDAHEAIRPTSVKRSPKAMAPHLSPEQFKIYDLIWKRFVACQMKPARLLQTTLDVKGGDYLFRTTGSVITFKGFLLVDEEKVGDKSFTLPEGLEKGLPVNLDQLDHHQHFTKPPARYNESSLVKELDQLGIGRPSTYASIITTLLNRKYVEKENRSLMATDLGMAVDKILVQEFPDVFNVDFTARMEQELDQIESGAKERVKVLNEFYTPFVSAIDKAMEKKDEIKESLQEGTEDRCPKCGSELVVKWGRNGKFIACTAYPECKHTQPMEEETAETDEVCDKCGSSMIVKNGRFGRFLACSNYPDCKNTKSFSTGVPCPEEGCDGELVEKRSRRGKLFFGCSKYPKCQFASWNRPVAKTCPSCGHGYMEEKSTKAKGKHYYCPSCKHIIPLDEQEN